MISQAQLFESAPIHDAGGKVRIPVPPSWKCDAVFSPDQRYRYELSRIWSPATDNGGSYAEAGRYPRLVLWIMMNPSTATAAVNDPTIARCCRFSQAWGYDGILIGNVCAYRAIDKRTLPSGPDAIGEANEMHLLAMAKRAALIVVAHGQLPSALKPFATATVTYLWMYGFKLYFLKLSKDNTPVHPLYLKETLMPVELERSAL